MFTAEGQSASENADDLLGHQGMQGALRAWSWSGRIANMHTERLLSLIGKAAPKRPSPTIERVVGAGTLTQLLRCHKAAGGVDPRSVKRSQLLKGGVPLACERKVKNPNMRRPHMQFVNTMRRELKAQGQKRSWADLWGSIRIVFFWHELRAEVGRFEPSASWFNICCGSL